MLLCELCGYKQLVEPGAEAVDITEIKRSDVQGKIPTLDPATNKTVMAQTQPKTKMYKCPSCGRGVRLRALLKPYAELFDKAAAEADKARREQDRRQRLEDGKPLEKKTDPDFSG